MEDAGSADELFRVLMGDKSSPAASSSRSTRLEVRNLDV